MKYYIRKCWKINLAAGILVALAAGMQVAASAMNMRILNTMVAGDLQGLLVVMAQLIGLWLVILVVLYARDLVKARALAAMHGQIRDDLTQGLSKMSPQQFRKNETGVYLSWYTNDIQQLDNSSFSVFFGLIANVTTLIGALAVLVYLDWRLALICVAGAVVLLFVPKLFEKKANQAGGQLSGAQEAFVKKLKSTLEGFVVLKMFDRTPYFQQILGEASQEVEGSKYAYAKFSGKMGAFFTFVSMLFQLGISFVTALFSIWQLVPVGAILSVGNLAGYLSSAIQALANASVSFATGAPVWKKFEEIRSAEGQAQGGKDLAFGQDIRLQKVGFRYGEKQVLDQMDLTFQKGNKYALVGPSGCGKTTVLKLLMWYLEDYTGSITIDGEELREYTLPSLYRQMSYIDQEVYLFDSTIRQNITLGQPFSDEQIAAAVRDSALEGDLANMPQGLETPVGENGNRLSGGQKQRVAIARALLHGQTILLMDEGTSALDKDNAYAVENKLLANPDLTVILVSHHLDDRLIPRFDQIYHLGNKSAAQGGK